MSTSTAGRGPTPGPWKLSATDDAVVVSWFGVAVAQAVGDYDDFDEWPIIQANARLIAAAPAMYAELIRARAALIGCGFVSRKSGGSGDPEINGIDAALALAEGR